MDISDNYFFSETEKIDEIIDETSEQNLEGIEDLEEPNLDEIGLMEERCSGLWNQIKDANVLNGSEFSKLSMSKLKLDADLLSREVQWFSVRFPTFSTNIQLRLDCVYQALSELQHKKENEKTFEEEEEQEENNSSNSVMASKFRKWLCRQELDLARIRQKIPFSRNSLSSLQDLELEQKYLQEQIQKEGRKLLCRLNIQRSTSTERKLFDTLEQRYLALWLASLESFELIVQFKKRLFTEDKEDLSSELEEGPDPKRRKTFETKIEEKIFENLPITTDLYQSNDLLATRATFVMDGVRHERQQPLPLGSDIGYSSGENNSVHEIISNAKSLGEDYREQYKENDVDPPLWAEQIAQSNELEKSFYRTVPLDDYGMTDLDTDEGGFGQEGGKYLTQKILQDFEEKIGQGKLELTDSLIVHVDSPENRPLNEFEEVMDLFGKDKIFVNSGRPFSEDDCESLSTFTENERERRKINSRKRSFKPPLLLNKNEVKQKIQNNRRRKCASDARYRNLSAYNGFLSNDFEWDDDAFIGYQNISVDNSFDKLPDILLDGDFNETKKAFSSFYDKFRQVLSESQNLNERLRELITFVDKSFDGTSVLFQELNSTFSSVSHLCNSFDERFDENKSNSFNFSKVNTFLI
ncbi:unnamed protein product [Meloidogyne enterolobii]|uniref:Uncharacterized protein n=1 Tax=Meloidogyne enterolobii TaxID=390850 RepID=A0ACB0YV13_MELEN